MAKTTGYILNGVYYKGEADPSLIKPMVQVGWKRWSHDRQREDHARDILQPYDRNGQPNERFIEQFPDDAKRYGFLDGQD